MISDLRKDKTAHLEDWGSGHNVIKVEILGFFHLKVGGDNSFMGQSNDLRRLSAFQIARTLP